MVWDVRGGPEQERGEQRKRLTALEVASGDYLRRIAALEHALAEALRKIEKLEGERRP